MHLPGIITPGTVVAITYAEGSPYRRIVIEVDGPQATADRLRTQLAWR